MLNRVAEEGGNRVFWKVEQQRAKSGSWNKEQEIWKLYPQFANNSSQKAVVQKCNSWLWGRNQHYNFMKLKQVSS